MCDWTPGSGGTMGFPVYICGCPVLLYSTLTAQNPGLQMKVLLAHPQPLQNLMLNACSLSKP